MKFKIDRKRLRKEIREWVEAIAIALFLVFGVIRPFILQAYKIPSGSMIPTLMLGDKLFVNKFLYRFREPERWEIIVFKYPEEPKKDFIKRVVAFGGEEVEIRDGVLFISGKPQKHPPEAGEIIYYNQEPFAAQGQKIIVPEDSYFVLGDNSLSSRDSRYWGFVPKKNLVGKAFFRWWPPKRVGLLE